MQTERKVIFSCYCWLYIFYDRIHQVPRLMQIMMILLLLFVFILLLFFVPPPQRRPRHVSRLRQNLESAYFSLQYGTTPSSEI